MASEYWSFNEVVLDEYCESIELNGGLWDEYGNLMAPLMRFCGMNMVIQWNLMG